ncbi:MAG: BamA/TamA family outer membrane protein [Gemmatimonadota bacterium]
MRLGRDTPGAGRLAGGRTARFPRRLAPPGLARVLVVWLTACLPVLVSPGAILAQAPLFLVDGETSVASVSFDVQGENPFDASRLTERMATEAPGGLAGLRSALDWLPFISAPEAVRFDPVSLQKDVVRIRRFYHSHGFPQARVDYRVSLDSAANQVDVVMTVRPGTPRVLDSLRIVTPSDPPAALELEALERQMEESAGGRLGEMEVVALRERAVAWARLRGFPFPRAETRLEGEDPLRPRMTLELDPGPMATVAEIRVEDGLRLDRSTIRRQLLVAEGDTFSARRLDQSAGQLLDLDLVEVALVETVPDQPRDSTVAVRVRMNESDPRLISGRAGYSDTRGILTEVEWANRNFFGGARTLRATALAETGIWSVGQIPRERYGGSLSLEQPWVGDPRISGIASVYADYSDGPREEARSVGTDLTLIWERGPQRFLSLRYGVSVRDVLGTRGGATELDILEFLQELEGLRGSTRKTSLTLSGGWGRRDRMTRPTRGWSVGASVEGAGPDGWSDVQYLRADVSAAWLYQVDSAGPRILARGRGGRLLPLGRSRPGDDPLRSFLQLGDAVFLEGGTQGVRGWGDGSLGPKLPDISLVESGGSVTAAPTDRYVPLGGLARLGGSVELQLPLPFLKLNPSLLDARDPRAVGRALLNGTELSEVPEDPWRRWHLHLAIGRVF